MLREIHWSGVIMGTGVGLVSGLLLFVIAGPLGANTFVQLVIQGLAFGAAGYAAGRFSLVHHELSGGISALLLFFLIAASTIAGGADANPAGLVLLGVMAVFAGTGGGHLAEVRRRPESQSE
ncbi:MAG: hypothetical protein ABFR95_04435 [Actinomycetota bacterium]